MKNQLCGGSGVVVPLGEALLSASAITLGPWAGRALCAGSDPEIFFPAHDDQGTEARQICGGCPVRAECLDYAIQADERHGIWGGLDPGERRNLRRRVRRHSSPCARAGAVGAA